MTIPRLPIECVACAKPLAGGLDTFADIDQPMCWACYSRFVDGGGDTSGHSTTDMEEDNILGELDDEELVANGGLIESRGMWFCSACGMLAEPGDKNFDWCDHINGFGCPYNDAFEDYELEE